MPALGIIDIEQFADLPWRIGFAYEDCEVPQSFELICPQGIWEDESSVVGGHDESGAGVQETFVIRKDRGRKIRARCTETEYRTLLEPMWLVLVSQAQDFTIQFDMAEISTAVLVQLVGPFEKLPFERDPSFYGLGFVELEVRSADGSILPGPFFQELEEIDS